MRFFSVPAHRFVDSLPLMQVRLDIATVIGLLAYVVNYKFESLASSPYVICISIS